MTHKEEAQNLISLFRPYVADFRGGKNSSFENARICAINAIDLIVRTHGRGAISNYWNKVKEELKKLPP